MLIVVASFALLVQTVTPAEPAPPKPAKEKRVCRAEPLTGSRMRPAKRCKTEAEWQAEAASGTGLGIPALAGSQKY